MASEIIEWALRVLNNPSADITTIVQTPWSSVLKINTGNEFFYLKHTPKLIALEAKIIQILREEFHASVPTVISYNPELNCFLMQDAGRSLRSILKQKFDADLLCKAIDQFTALQLVVADGVDVLLKIGVPDWRLDKLPDLYAEVIAQKNLLMEDGLSEIEISQLEMLSSKFANLCQKLSDYSIKPTIVQPDFNDNNTLIDDKSKVITLIDVGEISISHPFFSLLNCLQQVRKHYALTENDDTYRQIKDACLKNYMKLDSKKDILEALAIAQILWPIYGVLAQYRLMQACVKEKLMAFQPEKRRLSNSLREFMALCKND